MLNECKNKQKDEVQDRMYYAQHGNFPLKFKLKDIKC